MALAVSSGRRAAAIQATPRWRVAFVVKDSSDSSSVLLTRSSAAEDHSSDDLHRFMDSDVWELPYFDLHPPQHRVPEGLVIDRPDFVCKLVDALRDAGLKEFDLVEIFNKVQSLVDSPLHFCCLWKLFLEPDFGPKHAVHTAVVLAETPRSASLADSVEWFDSEHVLQLLVNETPHAERVGVLAANFFSTSFPEGTCCPLKFDSPCQEYPPGIIVMPMISRTLRPFCKTNLVICAPMSSTMENVDGSTLTADALIVDPGCSVPAHDELVGIVKTLPKRLLVFVTHHHLDHNEGLPAVIQANAEAMVLAHENTLRRMDSVLKGVTYKSVVGGTKIIIRNQRFEVIHAPGHTDGHLCLFHCDSRTIVAGDHCVGEGSSILDANSGGNLHDYMQTSHRLLELAPKVIVPMHGRPNLWPLELLKGYIRHRQTREATILKAIEGGGAASAFDIVSNVYRQTHISLWPAALLNVKSHVEHLQRHGKLPSDFSSEKFKRSCGWTFKVRWFCRMLTSSIVSLRGLMSFLVLLGAIAYYFWQVREYPTPT